MFTFWFCFLNDSWWGNGEGQQTLGLFRQGPNRAILDGEDFGDLASCASRTAGAHTKLERA
jgi:hypothetical protein